MEEGECNRVKEISEACVKGKEDRDGGHGEIKQEKKKKNQKKGKGLWWWRVAVGCKEMKIKPPSLRGDSGQLVLSRVGKGYGWRRGLVVVEVWASRSAELLARKSDNAACRSGHNGDSGRQDGWRPRAEMMRDMGGVRGACEMCFRD